MMCMFYVEAIHAAKVPNKQSNNRHLRRIIAQFRTGSHWLNIETGRHKKVDRSGRICSMSVGRITNPEVPADCFDAFDSDEDAPDPIEDEHHAIFNAPLMPPPGECFQIFFPAMYPLSASF